MAVDPLTDDSRWTVVGDCAGLLDYRLRGGRMIHRDAEIGEPYIEISCSVRGVGPLWREQQRFLIVCAALAAIWLISAVIACFHQT